MSCRPRKRTWNTRVWSEMTDTHKVPKTDWSRRSNVGGRVYQQRAECELCRCENGQWCDGHTIALPACWRLTPFSCWEVRASAPSCRRIECECQAPGVYWCCSWCLGAEKASRFWKWNWPVDVKCYFHCFPQAYKLTTGIFFYYIFVTFYAFRLFVFFLPFNLCFILIFAVMSKGTFFYSFHISFLHFLCPFRRLLFFVH